jgi:hypothetical protein
MPLKPPAADAGVVRRVAFAGERLLVLYAARSAAADGKLVRPTLVSYSVPEGKIRWQCLLLGRGAKAARHVSAWETGRQTIALWAAADDDQPARVILIDARSGEPLATPARFPASGELSSAGRPGCPAVLNGRLLVETEDGVALWKGRL